MNDIFGDALEKLSRKANEPRPVNAPPAVTEVLVPEAAAAPEAEQFPSPDAMPCTTVDLKMSEETTDPTTLEAADVATPTFTPDSPVSDDIGPDSTVLTVIDPETESRGSSFTDRQPIRFVLEHRRQTAAVLIVVCMLFLWFDSDGDTSPQSASGTSASTGFESEDGESILSDFDAVDVRPLREPADPVDVSAADELQFIIPSIDESAAGFGNSSAGNSPAADPKSSGNSFHDQQRTARRPSASNQSIRPTSSAGNRSVRFTGQIEPLK